MLISQRKAASKHGKIKDNDMEEVQCIVMTRLTVGYNLKHTSVQPVVVETRARLRKNRLAYQILMRHELHTSDSLLEILTIP